MVSRFQLSLRTVLALTGGMVLLTACSVQAQDKAGLQPVPESQTVAGHCPHCQQGQQGLQQEYTMGMVNYGHCPSCRGNMIDRGGWGHCDQCNRNGRISPGSGWCAPGKVPVVRERVQYWKYYPNYWSGHGPGPVTPSLPMVYTPTDTTQLGFYYQHAPSWTAQPWRVPGPAHPAYWHNRYCGRCRQPGYNGYNPSMVTYSEPTIVEEGEGKSPTPAQPKSAGPQESGEPQSIQLPAPGFHQPAPKLSLLPDAPPEV